METKEVKLSSIFDMLSVDETEVLEKLDEVKKNPRRRDSGICICGHARSKHLVGALGTSCVPGKQYCPCKAVRVVVETSDTRFFMFKTEGGGANHAIVRGMVKAKNSGAEVHWVAEYRCDRCQTEGPVSVLPVSQRGIIMSEATGYDVLLCDTCRNGTERAEA